VDPGILYSLVAALLWGLQIVALKRYFDDYSAFALPVLINGFAALTFIPFAAATTSPAELPSLATFTPVALGSILLTVVAIGAAFITFLQALEIGEVSYVAPINKLAPVFVLPIEITLLGAHLGRLELAGIGAATLAVYVANYEPGELVEPVKRAAYSRPAQLALLSAAGWGIGDVGKRVALQELSLPPQLWVPLLEVSVALVLLPVAFRTLPSLDQLRGDLPKFVALGGLVATAEYVTSLAFGLIPASIASPVINTQAVVAVVLGGLLLGEDNLGVRLVAALLAVAGVGLIAL
jgi:drug/metabolite transporter (DMT)-like permease